MSTEADRLKKVVDRLEALGSVKAIVKELKAKRIKGIPTHSDKCPIALYLQKEVQGEVWVGSSFAIIWDDEYLSEEVLFDKETAYIRTFILQFDMNRYPELCS